MLVKIDSAIKNLIPSFLENRQLELDSVKRAILEANYEKLYQIGHNLRGVAGSFGFFDLAKLGDLLESSGERKDLHIAEQALRSMTVYLNEVQIEYSSTNNF